MLAGLDAQADATFAAADDQAAEELARAAWAEVALLDRVRAVRRVVLEVAEHGPVGGDVLEVGRDVVVLRCDDGEWAVSSWGITAVLGVDEAVVVADSASAVLGLSAVARAWSRSRSTVRILRRGSVPLDGTIDAVGADHLDLAEHDPGVPRRSAEVRRMIAVPLAAITAMRRR